MLNDQLELGITQPNSNASSGKDELNLAEFPFALLSKHASEGKKTIEFTYEGRNTDGKRVEYAWVVTGSDKFGLPLAIDEEVYVALMKMLKDDGFANRTVRFKISQLLKIMRSGTGKADYNRIEQALSRLTGVMIYSKNVFWQHSDRRRVTAAPIRMLPKDVLRINHHAG